MINNDILLANLKSDQVLALQKALKALGYYTCPIDGKMGKHTNYAWTAWKSDNHLERYTEIGPNSWALIEKQLEQIKKNIDWSNFDQKISQYFTVGEVTNNDPKRIPTDPTIQKNILLLAAKLDKIREDWGSEIIVTSWYRPPAINRAVGGVKNSQHITGKAVDIRPAKGDLLAFQLWLDIRWNMALGYGARRGFVHLDLRPGRIRWHY